jgi:electron transfer flavoprotein beta subunit
MALNILVAVKRVPAPGAKIVLTEDGQRIDTKHLGFTVSPHEECAVEEAVRLVAAQGGSSTVITLGPPVAEDQLRTAISMGIDHGVLIETADEEWDALATAAALTDAIRALEDEGERFDLILFGNESADAGNYQVGIRVAHALDRPAVSGIKAIEPTDGRATMKRAVADGFEILDLPLPAVAAVKEGINLPRYPAMRGRLLAKKAQIRRLTPQRRNGGMTRLRLHHPAQQQAETRVLGTGADAAPAVAALFEEVGLL